MYIIQFQTAKEPLYLCWVKGKYDLESVDQALAFDTEDEAEELKASLVSSKRIPINGKVIRKSDVS